MIRINLTPEEELVNPYWWVPDAAVVTLTLGLGFAIVFYVLSISEKKINDINLEKQSVDVAIQELTPRATRYDEIVKKKNELISKVTGLKGVTSSRVKRYRPVILLEHLQTLKPEGLWFESVEMLKKGNAPAPAAPPAGQAPAGQQALTGSSDILRPDWKILQEDEVVIVGKAFDNLLVAEFMSALKATRAQEIDPKDLRTQVFFNEVVLDLTEMSNQAVPTSTPNRRDSGFDQGVDTAPRSPLVQIVRFSMKLKFAERELIQSIQKPISFKKSQTDSIKGG